ncbi:DUF1435 family protein [Morganella morganii]|uniref:DUF1435 family protein n=1 Tax=Morganella morganii TaxID=582 RepID=UPI0030FE63BB
MQIKHPLSSFFWQQLTRVGGMMLALIPVVLFLSQGHEQDAARIALAVVILLTMPMLYNRVLRHFLLIPAGIAFVLGSLLWFEHLRM